MTQVVCANCGQALRPTDKFCYNCGAKVVPIKMTPEVKAEEPKPEVIRNIPRTPVQRPQAAQEVKPEPEERPKFHMDESLSWNTDGYPEAQKHETEEANFSWNDSSAHDRIKKRQEEGREALFEEEKPEQEASKAGAGIPDEVPAAEEVVKAVDAASVMPISEGAPAFEETAAEPEAEPEIQEAEPEPVVQEAEPEIQEAPAAPFAAYSEIPAEEEDDGEVPTIESIEAEAEAAKAREVEKEIFGYTIDDVDSEEAENAKVIDKFYTYSKKNEEFQKLLDQENERLRGSRPEAAVKAEPEAPEAEAAEPEEIRPLSAEEAEGFVGVQMPETPMEADATEEAAPEAVEEPEAEAVEPEPEAEEAPAAEFLDGNFGKTDSIEEYRPEDKEDKPESDGKVAAAVGTVAASAAAFAKIADKVKARNAEAKNAEKFEFAKEQEDEFSDFSGKVEDAQAAAEAKADEIANRFEAAREAAAEKAEAEKAEAKPKADDLTENVAAKAEDIKADVAAEAEEVKEEAEDLKAEAAEKVGDVKAEAADKAEAVEDSFNKVKEDVEDKAEEIKAKADDIPEEIKKEVEEEEHKLTYQEVFDQESEKTSKHTFLKIIAILILLLIILEVVAILIRRFAPDSPAGLQIQQIYEMLFSRFTGN
ncbi:MAG: zinc ribbon domain-containing protein [Eubacterium sp.]|nr:zinc ribbon domain-containing protein [Eubacterium sp.]